MAVNQQKKSQNIWVLILDFPVTSSVTLVNQPSFLDLSGQVYKIRWLDLTLSKDFPSPNTCKCLKLQLSQMTVLKSYKNVLRR